MWDSGIFIGAVRRRMAMARGAHSVAICLAAMCAAGLALMPIAWWWEESASRVAWGMLALGVGSGMVLGITRRPSRLEAAVEADRQLGLDDLLGTIESLRIRPQSGWGEALLKYAHYRCRFLVPGDVKVQGTGVRTWAGVAILAALLLTVGLFAGRSASDASGAPTGILAVVSGRDGSGASSGEVQDSRPPGPGGSDVSNRAFEQERADDSQAQRIPEQNDSSHSAGASASVGSGAAVTQTHGRAEMAAMGPGSGEVNHGGEAAGGVGQSDFGAAVRGVNDSQISAGGAGRTATGSWESKRWGEDANQAMKAGWVPAEDLDLVREYFSRG
jgi:hypothetical protein